MYTNFDVKDYYFKGDGVSGTATKNTTTNIDYIVGESGLYISGAEFIYKDSVWGDYVECQIIDVDNVLGYGANTVLTQYVKKWYLDPNTTKLILESPYAGALPNGVYVRIKYHSVGTEIDPSIMINYFLHDAKEP